MSSSKYLRAVARKIKHIEQILFFHHMQNVREEFSVVTEGKEMNKFVIPEWPSVKYLWPHSNKLDAREELDCYEMKEGNAPSDSDRPEYLRGICLAIDVKRYCQFMQPGLWSMLTREGAYSTMGKREVEELNQKFDHGVEYEKFVSGGKVEQLPNENQIKTD